MEAIIADLIPHPRLPEKDISPTTKPQTLITELAPAVGNLASDLANAANPAHELPSDTPSTIDTLADDSHDPSVDNQTPNIETGANHSDVEQPAAEEPRPIDHADGPDPTDPAHEIWEIVERAQAGDTEAFEKIYDRYIDTVFRFAYHRTGNRQLAEDLTSDTFLRALKRIGSFTWQGRDLGAWLITITRNLVADHFKSGRNRLEVSSAEPFDASGKEPATTYGPEDATLRYLTDKKLLSVLKELNPEQQECITLRFLNGLSVAEVAQAMGKNEGAVKALQYRAVRTMRRLLPDSENPYKPDSGSPVQRIEPPKQPNAQTPETNWNRFTQHRPTVEQYIRKQGINSEIARGLARAAISRAAIHNPADNDVRPQLLAAARYTAAQYLVSQQGLGNKKRS